MIHENQPKKIVIVAGPTFGTVLGFVLLGAAIGAAGTLYLKSNARASGADDALNAGLSGGEANSAVAERANALMERVRKLSARARDTIHAASEALAPAVQEAIQEAKKTASQTERALHEELDKADEQSAEGKPTVSAEVDVSNQPVTENI